MHVHVVEADQYIVLGNNAGIYTIQNIRIGSVDLASCDAAVYPGQVETVEG